VTRVALLDHARGSGSGGGALAAADALLRRRGFTQPLAHVPFTTAGLLAGNYEIAHAFTPSDAVAALAWRRRTGRPVVFTCTETLSRANLANGRLRLSLLRRAIEEPDAVLAATPEVAESMRRWLALDAPVLDALGLERLYGELLAARG
jgi:hypothetical protein